MVSIERKAYQRKAFSAKKKRAKSTSSGSTFQRKCTIAKSKIAKCKIANLHPHPHSRHTPHLLFRRLYISLKSLSLDGHHTRFNIEVNLFCLPR